MLEPKAGFLPEESGLLLIHIPICLHPKLGAVCKDKNERVYRVEEGIEMQKDGSLGKDRHLPALMSLYGLSYTVPFAINKKTLGLFSPGASDS